MEKKEKVVLYRIIITAVFVALLNFIEVSKELKLILFLLVYLLIGYDILKKAFSGVINGQVLDENFLMTIATIGAICLAIYDKSGDYNEAIFVMLFYQIGELFQSIAVKKSRNNIKELMEIRPDYANLKKGDEVIKVDPDDVEVGSIILVKPGEKIPIDGIVCEGSSNLNTSNLTGESAPLKVSIGDTCYSGAVNIDGVLHIRTTKEFSASTVSQILELVEESQMSKAKSENFITKFARYYTPIVCVLAILLGLGVPIFRNFILNLNPIWHIWIYRALTFLVISCPCALVISIPLSFFAGIGGASRRGILIKGANYIETLSKSKYVVMDKTGTLTKGVFEVIAIHHSPLEKERLLYLAAHAEIFSNHPIAESIKKYYGKKLDEKNIKDVREISGKGVIATIDGKNVAVGNDKLMESINVNYKECSHIGTVIHIAVDKVYAGHILISDVIKPTSKAAISRLKEMGIKKIIMLTGDSKKVAKEVSEEIGIDEFYAKLMPQDKVREVQRLLDESKKEGSLIFVGDGINDAAVLTRADVGIAMGAIGSDAAIEASDVVLMDDNPLKIAEAINISKRTMKVVYQNIIFALGVKTLVLILGAVGSASMWLAIFADVGVMVLAVLNSIRILFTKNSIVD